MDLSLLLPDARLLLLAVTLDLFLGDPVYRLHPIRLLGALLTLAEGRLRAFGADGRLGGCFLFVILLALWVGPLLVAVVLVGQAHWMLAAAAHLFTLYSLIALGDLLKHGDAVDAAVHAGDACAARAAVAQLASRDTKRLDAHACRRTAVESLAENLVDGFMSPVFWYILAGLPGIIVFKLASTMDSMVGYKSPEYLRFGWFGARSDDLLNLIPARLCYLFLAGMAFLLPGCSGIKAARVGWQQHAIVPGPNAGWSEAAMAGAMQRRLAGPIWVGDDLVTTAWLGDPSDAAAGTGSDYRKARQALMATAFAFTSISAAFLMITSGA